MPHEHNIFLETKLMHNVHHLLVVCERNSVEVKNRWGNCQLMSDSLSMQKQGFFLFRWFWFSN